MTVATQLTPDSPVLGLIKEADTLFANRGTWEMHWDRIARKVFPSYTSSFTSGSASTPGAMRNQEQYDSTASLALWRFQSIMESMVVPASGKWHGIRSWDPVLMRNRAARDYFEALTETLFYHRTSPRSGFQPNISQGLASIGAFGTSCLFTDQFKDPTLPGVGGLRYRDVPLGEICFRTNHQGQVDSVYRRFKMTVRQIAQRWGIPEVLKSRLEKDPNAEVVVYHIVKPNSEYEPGRLDAKGKRFSSCYLLQEFSIELERGGYRTLPYQIGRYAVAPGEIFGRSPAMAVLPSIEVLQEEKKTLLKQGHLALNPVKLAHDDGIMDDIGAVPGSTIYGAVNKDGRPLVHTLPSGNVAVGKDMMDDERVAINDAFLVSLFQILVETPAMTATEVLERAREKGALLAPTMGRFQSEFLGPMIEREIDLLAYQGLLPEPPAIVVEAGAEYQVEYDAPLNRAMRAEEASGGMRAFQFAAEIAGQTQDLSLLDHFNTDVMIPELMDISGAPLRWARSKEDIDEIRQRRQGDAGAAQATQALPGMAAMMKAVAPKGTAPV